MVFFEILVYILSFFCLLDSRGKNKEFLFLSLIIYGVLLELLSIKQFGAYSYSKALITVLDVPLAVGFGWSVIIYTSMELSDRLLIPERAKPFMDALLALNIDLSMDAIAIRLGFWRWVVYGDWFGVPIGNFFGWYVVVLSFSALLRFLKKRMNPNISPFLSILFSLLILRFSLRLWFEFVFLSGIEMEVLSLILSSSLIWVGLNLKNLKTDNSFSKTLFSAPLTFHLFFFSSLILKKFYSEAPGLLCVSFSMMVLGIFVHSLPSLSSFKKREGE